MMLLVTLVRARQRLVRARVEERASEPDPST